MSTTEDASPSLADYFKFEPLLGSADPFLAWDTDLKPEEYGDQSGRPRCGSWDDSDSDAGDEYDSFSHASSVKNGDGDAADDDDDEWNVVYASASITFGSTATEGSGHKQRSFDEDFLSSPCCPKAKPLQRKDSKVRFCEQPPQVVCFEKSNLEDHSRLYYSVHELQTIIDDFKIEHTSKSGQSKITTATKASPMPTLMRKTECLSLGSNQRKLAVVLRTVHSEETFASVECSN